MCTLHIKQNGGHKSRLYSHLYFFLLYVADQQNEFEDVVCCMNLSNECLSTLFACNIFKIIK